MMDQPRALATAPFYCPIVPPRYVRGTSDGRKMRWYQIGNLFHSAMCCGMKATSRISPGISRTSNDDGAINAVTHPAATVAIAPIDRRAPSRTARYDSRHRISRAQRAPVVTVSARTVSFGRNAR